MIALYCRHHHAPTQQVCKQCKALETYALQRTAACKFGADKPVCSSCPVHCYKKEMRENIRMVMRYAGPRMVFSHPFYALMYLMDKKRKEVKSKKFKTVEFK